MQTLSVKNLRENFPKVRKQLIKGESIILIYQHIPFAKLTPIKNFTININEENELTDKEIETTAINDMDDDYLTKKEIDYYLSLKDI